jgi:trk system potassium uptake protein TrkH
MGFVVLAVAILPQLGVGGMQLYRAEMSGVAKEEKITPRIAETARSLWLVYVVLTLVCACAFWAAGMSPFDAIGHAYAALATGGFSTHDASIGYFNSPLIEVIAIFFMLAGGTNFAIHFLAWKRQSQLVYVQDAEVRMYFLIFVFSSLFVALSLYMTGTYESGWQSLRYASFQTASILTNTGFGTATFAAWPLYIPLFLVSLSYVGGCVGSTAGGMKVFRIILLAKLALQQLFLLAHPRAVSVVKHGGKRVPENVIYSVWGFYVLYIVTALLITGGMMATGLNFESAFGAVTATINTLGPGLGDVAVIFTTLTPAAKWLGIFAMLIGRLEVFTVLVLFLPEFWRS